jgi:hypothetical protein
MPQAILADRDAAPLPRRHMLPPLSFLGLTPHSVRHATVSLKGKRSSLANLSRMGFVGRIRIIDNGNFNFDLRYGIIRDPQAIKTLKLPPNIYASQPNEDLVYEFRSERLILGKLTGDAFVPELGSTIESYDDYKNKKLKSLRIYNLPEKYKQ